MAEDAVCLANYCDIMRCDVLGGGELDGSLTDDPSGSLNTDIQIWRESSGGRSELRSGKDNRRGKYGGAAGSSSCECREVARIHKSSQTTQQQTTATTATTTTTTSPVDDKSGTAASGSMTSYGGNHQRHCKRGRERGELGSSKGDSAISGSLGSASSHSSSSSSSASSSSPSSRSAYNGPDNEIRACDRPKNDDDEVNDEEDDDDGEDDATNLVESSSLPAAASDKRERGKEFEIRKLKSNCKPEELEKLKLQCQILVRDCIAGLLANLSVKDFQEIEGELNRAICWYLSCDKYWEDSRRQPRHTPWYLLIAFLLVLSTGISACYYIISIILGSGDEVGIDSNEENQDSCDGHQSSERALLHDPGGFGGDPMMRHEDHRRRIEIGEERLQVAATGDMPDHYIYVAYPPELKRRLLESCYNRTTRL